MNLSTHFSLEEMTASDTAVRLGLDNTPNDDVLDGLLETTAGLERVRTALGGVDLRVLSGYRCPKLNAAVHGDRQSQHLRGEAADFEAPAFGTPLQVCRALRAHWDFVGFDQLILEGAWVHISFSEQPRGEVLTAHFEGGRVTHTRGLP